MCYCFESCDIAFHQRWPCLPHPYDGLAISTKLTDSKWGFVGANVFQREHALSYPQSQFSDGPKALTVSTIFTKCGVITSSRGTQPCILNTNIVFLYPTLHLYNISFMCSSAVFSLWSTWLCICFSILSRRIIISTAIQQCCITSSLPPNVTKFPQTISFQLGHWLL